MRAEWERSREIIESAKQMRIAADGYIATLEEANKALAECVNGALEEMERLQKVNNNICLLYTSPSPRDRTRSRMPSSA